MMNVLCSFCFVLTMLLAALSPAHASQMSGSRTNLAVAAFRLQVRGVPADHTTFWVAYGPLNGRFGVVQMKPSGQGWYSAQARLPRNGRTVFAFLAAQGVVHTRLGPEPGSPVVTIRRVGQIAVGQQGPVTVSWQAPVG